MLVLLLMEAQIVAVIIMLQKLQLFLIHIIMKVVQACWCRHIAQEMILHRVQAIKI
jgi:hypothetical protein